MWISKKAKLLLSGSVANVFEWYDYALFGHFATIIGTQFFPADDSSAALLRAFLVFAVGYLMRPIGGVFFGILGDRLGRKAALSLSVICMAFPTMVIGLLPTYDSIGSLATILMISARMIQGLSMGGALTGSISFIIEHTPRKHHGLSGSLSMSGICLGILIGSLAANITRASMTVDNFNQWGWRLPFLMGFFILVIGFYIKKNVAETPLFEEVRNSGNISSSPLKEVIKKHWFDMLMSIFINSTGSVVFYIEAIYAMSFLERRGFDEQVIGNIASLCYIVMAIATLLAGWLSDVIGRRRIFVINIVAIIALMPLLINTLATSNSIVFILLAQVAISILAAVYIGPEPALQAEFYPTNVRNTALSVSYNTATSLFGGTTPYFMELIVRKTGSATACVWYVGACACLSLIGLYFYKDRSSRMSDADESLIADTKS